MNIELRIQQYHGQTDRHTEWLLELLVGAENTLPSSEIGDPVGIARGSSICFDLGIFLQITMNDMTA